ncbi:uncharacterized protein F4807DRAFT_467321 [Annulohypoxylon truncatum]|uniref:uncharacterized protein n=1 Tax=Annulohypoxylon truncatum TaxID=327061 RepID=UPI002007B47C|nr:uncharacterized protein F4807DRAFT_467321 [Annulohypoxylon truncatum]KAI1210203.1 hypothetical protein F4807DRAFT_467321 [Annulohypoxylon truncatum]
MSGRKGYDLSNLCMETRPRTRGPVHLHLQGPTISNDNGKPSSVSQSPFLSDSSIPSSFNNNAAVNNSNVSNQYPIHPHTNSHTPLEQHHVSGENPQQPLRLSPGYTKTFGQYTLYNQQTGRGWRRVPRGTDCTSDLTQHNPTHSSHKSVTNGSSKMEKAVGSDVIALAHSHNIADTMNLSTPLAGYKTEGMLDADINKATDANVNLASTGTNRSASQNMEFDVNSHINFDIDSAVAAAMNSSIHASLGHSKGITNPPSTHHNARGRLRLDRPARRASRKILRSSSRRGITLSPTIVGGFLAPPSTSPSLLHSRSSRLPSHPESNLLSPAISSALNKGTADSHPDSPPPRSTPQITLTAPSDDEDQTSFPVTRE